MSQINFESSLKILSIFGAAIAFIWSAYQFQAAQHQQAETRRIEATRPFLDRQLQLYTEATQVAALLATSASDTDIASAKQRFWSLYWGELALVEDAHVEAAMVKLGRALEQGKMGDDIQSLSLELARACRDSLAESWGVQQWRNPHTAPPQ